VPQWVITSVPACKSSGSAIAAGRKNQTGSGVFFGEDRVHWKGQSPKKKLPTLSRHPPQNGEFIFPAILSFQSAPNINPVSALCSMNKHGCVALAFPASRSRRGGA
jgi:hypothetical protein